jgi:hypothetical protein
MQRSSLNTAILQKKFPAVYKDFFGKCGVVLSASLSFSWINDFSKRYKGISIKQKLPFKTYIGIESTNSSGIEFGTLQQYEPAFDKFEENSFESSFYLIPEVLKYLDIKKSNILGKIPSGGRIHCLTELSPNHGCGFVGNFSALFSCLIYILSEQLSEEELSRWKNFSTMDLLNDRDFLFNEIFYTAWDIDYILKSGDSGGSGPFTSLIPGAYPIITFPAKTVRSRNFSIHKDGGFSGISKVPFWGYRLNDIYKDLPPVPLWPIDMGVVFSGKPFISERISQKLDSDINQYEDFKAYFKHLFRTDIEKTALFPDFYENCILTEQKVVNKFHDLFGVISLVIMRNLHQLLLHGYDESEIESFIGIMNKRHFASNMLDEVSPYIREFFLKLNSMLLQGKAFSNVGLFNTNNVMLGGGVSFVTYPQLNRMSLLTVFEEMKQHFSNMSVDYISWLDGYGESGVKVEQNLDGKKYSEFIDGSSVALKTYSKLKDYKTIIGWKSIETLGIDYDILCNLIDNSITVGGKVLSGKELHSKTATLAVLSRLLEKRNEEVSSQDFPRSSYSSNKNEMQGKIVLPLLKIIKERTHKDLGLSCSGSNTKFYLKLAPENDLKIGLINLIK